MEIRDLQDFDNLALFEPWATAVEHASPGLTAKLVGVQSPRPGRHVYFRSAAPGRNQVLAAEPTHDPIKNEMSVKALIETRGEGGFIVAPGSPPGCHASGRCYQFVGGKSFSDFSFFEYTPIGEMYVRPALTSLYPRCLTWLSR